MTTPASGKNRWFQLGLLSAGAAAPLIARWRSLRAAEQAEALRNQASARWSNWSDAISRAAASLPTDGIQGSIDSLQESLRQVAPQAQESLRQVSSAARDALQRLPGVNLPAAEPPAPVVAPVARRRANTTLWLMGVGVGVVAAGAVAYFALRNRMSAQADDDTLVEIPLTSPAILATNGASAATRAAAQAASVAADEPPIVEEPSDDEPRMAEPMPFSESDGEGAAFVGNILSRIYHPMDSKRLPSPQNRIYFASEAEAISAGYRADSAELASRSTEASEPGE